MLIEKIVLGVLFIITTFLIKFISNYFNLGMIIGYGLCWFDALLFWTLVKEYSKQ